MNATEGVRLTVMAAFMALTFATIFVAAAMQSAMLMVAAVTAGPIISVAIGLSGVRRP